MFSRTITMFWQETRFAPRTQLSLFQPRGLAYSTGEALLGAVDTQLGWISRLAGSEVSAV